MYHMQNKLLAQNRNSLPLIEQQVEDKQESFCSYQFSSDLPKSNLNDENLNVFHINKGNKHPNFYIIDKIYLQSKKDTQEGLVKIDKLIKINAQELYYKKKTTLNQLIK